MHVIYTSNSFQIKSSCRRCGQDAKIKKGASRVRFFETDDGWIYKLYA